MKKTLLFATLALASFTACEKKTQTCPQDTRDQNNPGIAPGGCVIAPLECCDAICTQDLRQIMIRVKDNNGNPVALDSFVVTDLSGVPLPPAPWGEPVYDRSNPAEGVYTLINDGWVDGHRGYTMSVRAKGYINSTQVFDQPYVIAADCCHVSKASGDDTVVVPGSVILP